jgi:hypothetical protein
MTNNGSSFQTRRDCFNLMMRTIGCEIRRLRLLSIIYISSQNHIKSRNLILIYEFICWRNMFNNFTWKLNTESVFASFRFIIIQRHEIKNFFILILFLSLKIIMNISFRNFVNLHIQLLGLMISANNFLSLESIYLAYLTLIAFS